VSEGGKRENEYICGGEIMEGRRKNESDSAEGECWVWLLENWVF